MQRYKNCTKLILKVGFLYACFLKKSNRPEEVIHIGGNHPYLGRNARWNMHTPGGHPEGFIEAFANIYRNFTLTVMARLNGEEPTPEMLDFPNVNDGVRGMQFIETIVESGWSDGQKWTKWITDAE